MTVEPDPKDTTLARFDPMLRALVAFGLVECVPIEDNDAPGTDHEGGSGRSLWILTPAVQRRLGTLVSPTPPADKLIYFGHRCSSCGEHAPTRLLGGALLCDSCRSAQEPQPARSRQGA